MDIKVRRKVLCICFYDAMQLCGDYGEQIALPEESGRALPDHPGNYRDRKLNVHPMIDKMKRL